MALRRFARHRLGMLGLVLVTVLAAGVVIIPWISRLDPSETRPWIGARPPLFRTPDAAAENVFMTGRPPETSPRAARCRALEIVFSETEAALYRIALRGEVIASIAEHTQRFDSLDLATYQGPVVRLRPDGRDGRAVPRAVLRTGAAPPEGLFDPGERVVLLRAVRKETIFRAFIHQPDGIVQGIVLRAEDGSETRPERLSLRGESVRRVVDRESGRALEIGFWFGSDDLGRDLLVRVFAGGRISLMIGAVATLVSLLIGVIYGAVAGYSGPRTDRAMMGAVDVLYAVPFLFLVIVLMVAFGRHLVLLFVALGAVQWLTMARIVRGQIRSLKHLEFVEAARLGGAGPARVVFRHLLPHTTGPVLVYATLTVPIMIMEESFLAFIGLQAHYAGRPLDSWGALIHGGVQALGQAGEKSWLLLFPAVIMALMLFGLNALGDGLRDAFDPREGGR